MTDKTKKAMSHKDHIRRANTVYLLRQEGKTYKEISEIIGRSITICRDAMARYKHRAKKGEYNEL